jgi:hypothetical protein
MDPFGLCMPFLLLGYFVGKWVGWKMGRRQALLERLTPSERIAVENIIEEQNTTWPFIAGILLACVGWPFAILPTMMKSPWPVQWSAYAIWIGIAGTCVAIHLSRTERLIQRRLSQTDATLPPRETSTPASN